VKKIAGAGLVLALITTLCTAKRWRSHTQELAAFRFERF
jgi:hypothetical protein